MKTFSRLLVMVSLFLGISTAQAVQAPREPRTFSQPDGTSITLTLVGDEFYSFYLSDDGRMVLQAPDGGYYYAEVDPDSGTPRPSQVLVGDGASVSKAPARFEGEHDAEALQEAIAKARNASPRLARRVVWGDVPDESAENAPRRVESANSTNYSGKGLFTHRSFTTVTGSPHVLVILAEYSDYAFQTANAHEYFDRMLNAEGFSQNGATGSVSDYFKDASGNQFTPIFDVYGPVTLPNTRKFYGEYVSESVPDRNDMQMVVDAVTMLDDEVDYSIFDNDNDGNIDNVFIIFAGLGQVNGGGPDAIWPSSFNLEYGNVSLIVDGKKVKDYGCSCELNTINDEVLPDGIGTFCHEFSHVLGLPDEYDINYGEVMHKSMTPGPYSIMDMGNYNNNGRTPPTYSLYQRNALRWANTTSITTKSNKSLRLGNLIDTNNGIILGLGSPYNEFFLFENRQNKPGTWDEYLPGHGMLVWHITYNSNAWNSTGPNTNLELQRIDIVEACNQANYVNSGALAQYPFPGPIGKSSITPYSTPALTNSNGEVVDISITGITENPLSGFITLVANSGSSALVYAPTPSINGFKVKTSPYKANGVCDLALTPDQATDEVNYIYKDLDGEVVSSGVCKDAVHITGPGTIEYWASYMGMSSEHCFIDLAFTAANVTVTPNGGSFIHMPEVTITTPNADSAAAIYYTVDGSVPTAENGVLYEGPFTLDGECTLKAIATVDGWAPSGVTAVTFDQATSGVKVATPTFMPEPGEVADKTCVTAICDTEDAVIHYTTDGTEPSVSSKVFPADGLTLRADTDIKVRAFKDDCATSDIATASYAILPGDGSFKLMTDVAVLAPGVQVIIAARDTEVAMSHSSSVSGLASIVSTPIEKNGKTVEPDENVLVLTLEPSEKAGQYRLHADGDLYVAAISDAQNALGFRTLEDAGDNASVMFEIKEGCTYVVTQGYFDRNNIRCDKKYGFLACTSVSTKPVVEVYYRLPLDSPVFSPEPGYIHAGDVVKLTTDVEGASIRFTTDGSEPTESSEIFPADGIAITESTIIKAKSYADTNLSSVTVTGDYRIIDDTNAYRLLTDPSELQDGDNIIIGQLDGSRVMSTAGSDFNRKSVQIARQGDSVVPTDDVQLIKLEAANSPADSSEEPLWRFNVGENAYLYADSSTGNSIKIGSLEDAGNNANATIGIDESGTAVTFQGESTHNSLRTHPSSHNYLCYLPTSVSAPKVALYYRHPEPIEPDEPEEEGRTVTGVEGVNGGAMATQTRYYTLQGIRVMKPAPGNIYIVVNGSERSVKRTTR